MLRFAGRLQLVVVGVDLRGSSSEGQLPERLDEPMYKRERGEQDR